MFSDNTECEILFGIPSSDTICTINFYGCRNTNFHCFQHQEHKDIHQENLSVVVCLYSCMPNFFFCCYTVLFSGHNCLFSCIFLFNGSMCQVNFGWKNKQTNINQNSSAIFKKKNYEKKSLQKSHATLSSTLTEDL